MCTALYVTVGSHNGDMQCGRVSSTGRGSAERLNHPFLNSSKLNSVKCNAMQNVDENSNNKVQDELLGNETGKFLIVQLPLSVKTTE